MKQFSCPDCYKPLSAKAIRCTCGWRHQTIPPPREYRCHYENNHKRCPLPGTICPNPYGNSPWYCSGHWSSRGDPKLSELVLQNAEKNYQAILAHPQDWRLNLFTGRKPA
jgi:hypothetical protein